MKKNFICALLIMLCMGSILADGFNPKADRPATIIVYREKQAMHSMGTYDVCINQFIDYKLKNGEFLKLNVNPGEYLIDLALDQFTEIGKRWDAMAVDIKSGDKVIIRAQPGFYVVKLVPQSESPDLSVLTESNEYVLLRGE